MDITFPPSLQTTTPAEGHALARQLAELALRRPAPASIAAHLTTGSLPAPELLTAVYFQAIVVANAGWRA